MRMAKARQPHRCKNCGNTIGVGERYWSYPYKALCVGCYGNAQQSERNVSQPYKEGDSCNYCEKPAIGYLCGNNTCLDHLGDAVYVLTQDGMVDENNEVNEENVS